MTSQHEITKRNRSRPSNWWEAAASPVSTPPVRERPPPQKQVRSSKAGTEQVPDSSESNKRGNDVRRKAHKASGSRADALGGGVAAKVKSGRKGRASGDRQELETSQPTREQGSQRIAATAEDDLPRSRAVKGKQTRPVSQQLEKQAPVIQETQSQAVEGENTEDTGSATVAVPKPTRKGRSSLTEGDVRATSYKEAQTRKPRGTSQPLSTEKQGAGVDTLKSEKARRGRPSNTAAEIQATVNPRDTEDSRQAKSGSSAAKKLRSRDKSQQGSARRGAGENPTVPSAIRKQPKAPVTRAEGRNAVQTSSKSVKSSTLTENPKEIADSTRSRAEKAQSKSDNVPSETQQSPQLNRRKRKEAGDEPQPAVTKRRRTETIVQDAEPRESQTERHPSYRHLAAVTHRISRHIIEEKWDALPLPCIQQIAQIFHDIQRPVVVRLNDERKRDQASNALQTISRRLISKISKGLPFPPPTRSHREDDFDFEKILDHNRKLEFQLTPALHANELLEAEIVKEKARLEAEEAELAELELNAKAESSKRKQDVRKLHPLLQSGLDIDSTALDVGIETSRRLSQDLPTVEHTLKGNEDLQRVVEDLQGHLDSIEGNTRQVGGITQAMMKSKAAVQATLFEHLDSTRYEEIVLG